MVAYSPFGHDSFPGGRVLEKIAAAHNATTHQVALRFLLRNPAVLTIPKASTLDHVRDNAGAGDLQLSAEEIEEIDRAFPRGKKPRSLPML